MSSLSLFKDEKCAAFFEYFGLLVFGFVCVKNGLRVLNNIGTFFMGLGSVNFKKYGSWAVVTGCTDGIGKAYAEQLAKKGLNLVLISRTQSKLEEQASQLRDKYKIETRIIAADFTLPSSIYTTIKQELHDLDIGVLVNNVGMSYKHPEFFDILGQDDKYLTDMINCNIMSVTKMSAIVLPGMVKKGCGIIINNASGSGRLPTPLLTVYSATKAYVDFFSRALSAEYKTKGVLVQSLCPYFVSTKLSAMRSSLLVPNPTQYVSSALNTINSQPVTNGCLLHNIQGWLLENIVPSSLLDSMTLKQLLVARSKALHKARKAQEVQKTD